jgi:hypothetical protein
MTWDIEFHSQFALELKQLPEAVKVEILMRLKLLGEYGPALGRPNVDTLNGSRFKNMKELRFDAEEGVWRVAFAFDPRRRAILLVAGDKAGANQKQFYKTLIKVADDRFGRPLQMMENRE